MKKAVILLLILTLSVLLVACGEEKSELDILKENISYVEHDVCVADGDIGHVELKCISGEVDPIIDGEVGKKDERYELKFIPKNIDNALSRVRIRLKDKESIVEVELCRDVLGLSYTTKMEKTVLNFTPSEVIILDENGDSNMPCVSVLKDCKVDEMKALEIAYNEVKESVSSYIDKGKLKGEVVIKLLGNKKSNTMPYYYFVSIAKSKDESASVLIDPNTGEIVNKKLK